MPLDELQELIARTALGLPEARTLALAGGAAMIAHGFVDRATHDVDLFTDRDDGEAVSVVSSLRGAIERQGLRTRNADRPPSTTASLPSMLRGWSASSRSSPTAAGSAAG